MSFLDLFGFSTGKTSSEKAKDRLRIIVESNPRSAVNKHMKAIQQEIFAILAKYLKIPEKDFSMQFDDDKNGRAMIELCVQLPEGEES